MSRKKKIVRFFNFQSKRSKVYPVKKDLPEINEAEKTILGIGFTNDKCILTVTDLHGNIKESEKISIAPLKEMRGRIREVKDLLDTIKNRTALKGKDFFVVGVALPEDRFKQNFRMVEVLSEGISHIFNKDVFTAWETTATGYGEKDLGEKTKNKNVLYMHSDIGNGVFIKDQAVFEADTTTNDDKAYLRPWDQFDIAEMAKELVNKGVGTSIVAKASGQVRDITLETVLDAASDGDEVAEDLIERSGLALGVRISYLANVFGAERVVLGGVEKGKGKFSEAVRKSTEKFLLNRSKNKVKITTGVLGEEASSLGAASLCRREILMEV